MDAMALPLQKEVRAPPNTDSNSGGSHLGCFGPSSKSGSSGEHNHSSNKSKNKLENLLWAKKQNLNKIIEMNLCGHESFLDMLNSS